MYFMVDITWQIYLYGINIGNGSLYLIIVLALEADVFIENLSIRI